MTGRHSRSAGDRCTCSSSQITHTCSRLDGKQNHNYDENAAQAQTSPLPRVNSVDGPPPVVGD